MVRIINIDTKTRTIRVSNEDKDIDWITVKGTHVPIKKGESKGEAVEKFFEDKGRKFYRGSVVHKDTIDGLKKAKDKHSETMKYWESEGKKNHKEKGYADFVKKEIEAQKQYAKRLDESIADISRDFEIDPEDIGMNKEFDDWKKSKQPAKKAKETYADTSEIDGAEVLKDGDDYVVLYANGTKSREFSSKTEADKFAKSLSEQPAKQEPEEKAKSEPAARDVMKESATDWYAKAFKSDKKMAPKNGVTFEQLYESLKKGENIYDKMGVGDSIVRERVMSEMADRMGVDYDHVFDLWLNGGEKGSEPRKKNQEESIALMDKLLKQANIDPSVKKAIIAARKRAKQDIQ